MSGSKLLILFTLLLATINCFNMEGPWRVSEPFSQNKSIIFDFKKQVVDGNISRVLSVSACRVIEFSFTSEPDSNGTVGFIISRMGIERSQCSQNEIQTIISNLQKVGSAQIILNTLTLKSASGQTVYRLTKVITTRPLVNLEGAWIITQLNGAVSNIEVQANQTFVHLCGGRALIAYEFQSQLSIRFRVVQTSGCAQNGAISAFFRGRFIRLFNNQVLLHEQDGQVLLKMIRMGNFNTMVSTGHIPEIDQNSETLSSRTNITNSPNISQSSSIKKNVERSQFFRSWYSFSSNKQILLSLTPTVLRIVGSCGIWYSLINWGTVNNDRLSVLNAVAINTNSSCPNDSFKNQIDSMDRLSLREQNNRTILQIQNQNGQIVGEWSNSPQNK